MDVWAYGVILFEILTGKSLFARPSIAETTAAVLQTEPDYNLVPEAARRLCRSCLQKAPTHRLRDIGDAHLLIGASPVAVPASVRTSRYGWAAAALCAALRDRRGVAPWRSAPGPAQPVRFQITPRAALVVSGASAISPDGRHLAFLATGSDGAIRVWVRDMESLTERILPDALVGQAAPRRSGLPTAGSSPSMRGQAEKDRQGRRTGGNDCRAPNPVVGGSWSRDGVVVFSAIDAESCACEQWRYADAVTNRQRRPWSAHRSPFSARRASLSVLVASRSELERTGIFVASIDSKPESRISVAAADPDECRVCARR